MCLLGPSDRAWATAHALGGGGTSQPPALTSETQPALARDPRFKVIDDADVAFFRSVVSRSDGVLRFDDSNSDTMQQALLAYNVDWVGKYRGASRVVLRPETTAQVSAILRYCNDKSIAVVPQGGNTGAVAGGVPVFDEVIISLRCMNRVREFDAVSGVIVADAGCTLGSLDAHAAQHGYSVPVDIASKDSCTIGGNVSTNAGGLRYVRFGSMHGNVLGLEVVLADGTILDTISTLRKDSSGYDVKQMFIGAEGTLGVVTGVAIATPVRPSSVHVALVALKDYESGVLTAFEVAKRVLGETLSAFEFWDRASRQCVHAIYPDIVDPLGARTGDDASGNDFTILIEVGGSNPEHDLAKLREFLRILDRSGVAIRSLVGSTGEECAKIWRVREMMAGAAVASGAILQYDVSAPTRDLYALAAATREWVHNHKYDKEQAPEHGVYVKQAVGFGHVGDGNLHLMVVASKHDPKLAAELNEFVYGWIAQHRGSIAAEHGLGIEKPGDLKLTKQQPVIALMHRIKSMLDPNGIMNPYKVLEHSLKEQRKPKL